MGGWVGGCIHHTAYVTADKGNVSFCVVYVHSSDSRFLLSHGYESYRKSDQNLNLFQHPTSTSCAEDEWAVARVNLREIASCTASRQAKGVNPKEFKSQTLTRVKHNKKSKQKQTNKQTNLVARAALVKTQYFHWASRSAASPEQLNASNVVSFGVSPSVTARVVNVKLLTWIGAASTHRYLFPTELPPRVGQSTDSLPSASAAVSLNVRTA
jgi:hypothetical protein